MNMRLSILGLVLVSTTLTCTAPQAPQSHVRPLRISVLPDIQEDKLRAAYEPLFDHLAKSIERPVTPVFYSSYDALLDAFVSGDVDVVFFGGLTFVLARAEAGAEPLVMRDVDTRFTSYLIASADSPGSKIEDFEGGVLAFGSRLSTSGHLMPRHFLQDAGIYPEHFFQSVVYTGRHDATIYRIRDGLADIGVVNAKVFDAMVADGQLDRDRFKLLYETPPYADYVWTVRAGMDEPTKIALTNAFLDLMPLQNPAREILANMDAEFFLPARESDFDPLAKIAEELNLLGSPAAT